MAKPTLNDRALLVQLSISQWAARKYDRKATSEVIKDNQASTDAGRFNKSLLPMSDQLKKIHQKSAEIRAAFYDNTLPWGLDGMMILPAANYMSFMTKFRQAKSEWQLLVDTFLNDYDSLRAAASVALGALYNPDDYPALQDVANKFGMDITVFPVPANDFRVGLGDAELERIQQEVTERVTKAQAVAMAEVWQRLYDRAKHMADKLSDPKGIFRDSMVDNVRDICDLLPRLNIDNDERLESMRKQLAELLIHKPDTLRHDPLIRQDTAKTAQDIVNQMGAFMGAH